MLNLWKKNKKYLIFALVIVLIGLIVGIIYYNIQSSNIKENIIYTLSSYGSFKYNAILKDLIITSLLLVSSFLIIGLPLSLFYFFYEGLSIGFLISIFLSAFKIKGLIYIVIYLLFNKILTLIIMIFFIKKIIDIARLSIGYIIYKKDSVIMSSFISSLSYIIILLIINVCLYFISIPLFSKLTFLLN